MRRIKDVLRELDLAGATGLDMSPGDSLCRDAAEIIRALQKNLPCPCKLGEEEP